MAKKISIKNYAPDSDYIKIKTKDDTEIDVSRDEDGIVYVSVTDKNKESIILVLGEEGTK